jgi:hypothetical protein
MGCCADELGLGKEEVNTIQKFKEHIQYIAFLKLYGPTDPSRKTP